MPSAGRSRLAAIGVAIAAALIVGGCAGSDVAPQSAGLACVDDSWDCINKRQATLKTMMADDKRGWIRETPTPQAHASGVRLFAYRGKKKELSCDELAAGKREADGAGSSLRGASGLTPAQVSRGSMLASEVSRELAAEMGRRCKKG